MQVTPLKDSLVTWSRLRAIGKSPAAKMTVLLPLIGYLIIFNKSVAEFLHLVSELAGGSEKQLMSVSPKLMLVYLGTCGIAMGQVLYGVFCPSEVKAYGHETPYVADAEKVTKDFGYEKLEAALRESAYNPEYQRMRDRYEKSPFARPITEDQKAIINNGVLHLHFRLLNNRWLAARWATAVFYFCGLVCLMVPSLGVFVRVMKIIGVVIFADYSQLF
ncbi:hypothetical protein I6F30_29740 [Bradyrhizobium sp. NBAIM20]|uniref:hypothetical protein n=1 Tax=unclassified Bradyrhizobium TaxID=2631580 RepID=UPI001CD3373C|nr:MULTISPECIES: hypothetical protein [unclassified Bradyrhizobium]MCA1415281.1 hypothetical protein [Bradyrhizobium sp. NBAIM20]MCA1461125.1 hypothetical protein [Bradyrhizobium sp. NBAIM18]